MSYGEHPVQYECNFQQVIIVYVIQNLGKGDKWGEMAFSPMSWLVYHM